jgi:hypothetical protein
VKTFVEGSTPHFAIEASVSGTWLISSIPQYGKALTMKKKYGHHYLSALKFYNSSPGVFYIIS